MRNPYEVLGISPKATAEEIRKAYRQLAKKYHPDLHPGDKAAEEKFKEVSAANDLLSDPEKRARFDRGEIDETGAERRERSFYRSYAEGDEGPKYWTAGDGGGADFSEDMFADLFGGMGRGAGATRIRLRGADVTYSMRCPFLDAVRGAKTRITLPDGKTLDVNIPPGTNDRQTLRLKGQGMPGINGGPAGDAFVEIHIEPHAFFTRKDDNIHVEVPVGLAEAVLGGKIKVPTVDGPVTLTVPSGSNTGTTLRLRGKGVPGTAGRPRGDQYVMLKVVLPDSPDDELRAFLERWAPNHPYDARGKAGMT
jgi:DnaJ-class molecular chaperone